MCERGLRTPRVNYLLAVEVPDLREGGEDDLLLALEDLREVPIELGVVGVHGEGQVADIVTLRLPQVLQSISVERAWVKGFFQERKVCFI